MVAQALLKFTKGQFLQTFCWKAIAESAVDSSIDSIVESAVDSALDSANDSVGESAGFKIRNFRKQFWRKNITVRIQVVLILE